MTNEATLTDESGHEGRWKAWVAQVAENDKAMHSRAVGVSVAVTVGLVLWLVGLVALG